MLMNHQEIGARGSARSRFERWVPLMLALGVLLTTIDIVWAFTLSPLVQGAELSESTVIAGRVVTTKLLLSQKIFYIHVPVAVASFGAMAPAAFWALRFLMTGERRYDLQSKTAMEVTLVFVVATMVSGIMWTRFEWGVWWVWEPRLTTYFILTLLVIAYFILRNAFEDPERRARFASVFGIVAFIDAPISFLITRLVPSSIHPVVFRTDSGLPPLMLIPFLLGLFGMLMIAFALYQIACRVNTDALAVEALKQQLEEQDARRERAAADEALERLRAAGAQLVQNASDDHDDASGSADAVAPSERSGASSPGVAASSDAVSDDSTSDGEE